MFIFAVCANAIWPCNDKSKIRNKENESESESIVFVSKLTLIMENNK